MVAGGVAALVKGDLKGDGKECLIVVLLNGDGMD